jgi:hypothetical protein
MMRQVGSFDKSISLLTLGRWDFLDAASEARREQINVGLLNMQSGVDFRFFPAHCQSKIVN